MPASALNANPPNWQGDIRMVTPQHNGWWARTLPDRIACRILAGSWGKIRRGFCIPRIEFLGMASAVHYPFAILVVPQIRSKSNRGVHDLSMLNVEEIAHSVRSQSCICPL